MWSSFYAAGGWGMHPITFFGFFLITASALYALRPQTGAARVVVALAFVTFAAGLLGTCTGVSTTLHYIHQVEPARQLPIMAEGIAESLHNIVFALILDVLGGLLAIVGLLRARTQRTEAGAA
jgi:hypothetical protein